jgi:hypothetical protein
MSSASKAVGNICIFARKLFDLCKGGNHDFAVHEGAGRESFTGAGLMHFVGEK